MQTTDVRQEVVVMQTTDRMQGTVLPKNPVCPCRQGWWDGVSPLPTQLPEGRLPAFCNFGYNLGLLILH